MRKIPNIFLSKFQEQGYETIEEFRTRTGIPTNKETIRLLLYENRQPTTPVLIYIMYFLRFTPDEISDYLKAIGEKVFSNLIKGTAPPMLECEEKLLKTMSKLKIEYPPFFNALLENIEMGLCAARANNTLSSDETFRQYRVPTRGGE